MGERECYELEAAAVAEEMVEKWRYYMNCKSSLYCAP